MKPKTLLFVATAMLTPVAHAQTPCDVAAKVCNVAITVDKDTCVPTPDFDPVPVKAGVNDVTINWRIAPASVAAGFRFVGNNGIVPPSNPQFSPITVVAPTHVLLKDRNTDTRPTNHKYSINVAKRDGTACPTLDPTIINGAN